MASLNKAYVSLPMGLCQALMLLCIFLQPEMAEALKWWCCRFHFFHKKWMERRPDGEPSGAGRLEATCRAAEKAKVVGEPSLQRRQACKGTGTRRCQAQRRQPIQDEEKSSSKRAKEEEYSYTPTEEADPEKGKSKKDEGRKGQEVKYSMVL